MPTHSALQPAGCLALCLAAMATVVPASPAEVEDAGIAQIAAWMTGTFDTARQVAEDEAAGAAYTHVHAVMRVVPITVTGLGGPTDRAFYVEQAMAGAEQTPYRQRVYLLTRHEGVLINQVFRLTGAESLVGAGAASAALGALTLDRLQREDGCELVWTRVDGTMYSGIAGLNGSCRTSHRGAATVVSQVLLTADALISLDQGFDAGGHHVWGPPPGTVGHIFRRRSAGADPQANSAPPR